jgi:hypothetical protein
MQQQNGHENLLRPNTRNQRQQIESGRDVKDCRIGKKVENNNAIKNRWHASLSTSKKTSLAEFQQRRSLTDFLSTLNHQLSTFWCRDRPRVMLRGSEASGRFRESSAHKIDIY